MKKNVLIPLTLVTLLLSGCASYRATSLNNLGPEALQEKQSDVAIVSKVFSPTDCKKFLGRNVIRKGYQPVQLFIQNNSDKNYVFSMNRISLTVAPPEEVAEKVHTSTVGRAVGYSVGALFFWPLIIPAIVDGVKSNQANESLDNDFAAKAAKDQVIYPHSHMNTLLFIPTSSYQNTFTVTLLTSENKPETFQVIAN